MSFSSIVFSTFASSCNLFLSLKILILPESSCFCFSTCCFCFFKSSSLSFSWVMFSSASSNDFFRSCFLLFILTISLFNVSNLEFFLVKSIFNVSISLFSVTCSTSPFSSISFDIFSISCFFSAFNCFNWLILSFIWSSSFFVFSRSD